MPGETSTWKIPFAQATDEVKLFPSAVDQPKAERVDVILAEKIFTLKTWAGPGTLKTGELATQETAGATFTLPAATGANQRMGVACKASSCKLTTSGGAFLWGKWITLASKTATVELTEGMFGVFRSDGANWLVTDDVKSGQTYSAKVERVYGTEYEPSASRPATVVVTISGSGAASVFVAGTEVGKCVAGAGENQSLAILVNPGQKWKATGSGTL